MTDKDELTTNESTETPENKPINTDDLDVEGALAALSSLQDLTLQDDTVAGDAEADRDSASGSDNDIEPDDDDTSLEIEPFERPGEEDDSDAFNTPGESISQTAPALSTERTSYESNFPHPPVSTLHRGQLASVIPALLLIGIGGYLTFLITTTDSSLQFPVILAMIVVGTGVMLLAQWLSTSRWSIGSFFIGVLLLLTGGTVAYLVLPTQLSLISGYPLIATAIGTAFVITDVFMPSGRRIWLIGLILAIGGLVGVFAITTLVNLPVVSSLSGLLPVALVILVILILAPFVSRRQQ